MQTNVKQWVRAAAVRAAKTAAQAALGVIGASAAMGDVQWALVGSAAVLAAIVSMLTSVTGIPEVDEGASIAKIAKQ
ncbi:holin [Gordonibacter pamelaeae]|uniref:holin n=1 Tax=Gordonibacter pamelaeae TaxID=471189 RepID=UPI001D0679AA|nr:holin [Gordonibacter pamelaeae]MCB6311826.1 holin [Gordonibacter pamelaeae]